MGRFAVALVLASIVARTAGPAAAVPVNLAPFGTASQSTTAFVQNGSGPAENGNDGNVDGRYVGSNGSNGSVTHTDSEPGAFWEVQLTDDFAIDRVVVYNRTDTCCLTRINPFELTLFDGATEVFSVIEDVFTADVTAPNGGGVRGAPDRARPAGLIATEFTRS